MWPKNKKDIGLTILICIVLSYVFYRDFYGILINPCCFQWDFKRYYFAGRLSLLGYNPYNFEKMLQLFGDQLPLKMPFLYPPYTLIFFRLLSRLSMLKAYYLFFILKFFMYGFLIAIWKKVFFKGSNIFYFLLFIAVSIFSEGVCADFSTGNISVIEQLLFWIGIVCFVKRKLILSGIFILFSASFKFLLSSFLVLFLVVGFFGHFFIFLSTLITLFVCTYLMSPFYFGDVVKSNFQKNALNESGHIAISIRVFLKELNISNPTIFYVVMGSFIAVCFIYIVAKNHALFKKDNLLLIYFSIITYCLIMPILKDYEQIILIPPAYFLLDYFYRKKQYIMEAIFVFLFFVNPHFLYYMITKMGGVVPCAHWNMRALYFILNYHILFTLVILWIVYIFIIFKKKSEVFT